MHAQSSLLCVSVCRDPDTKPVRLRSSTNPMPTRAARAPCRSGCSWQALSRAVRHWDSGLARHACSSSSRSPEAVAGVPSCGPRPAGSASSAPSMAPAQAGLSVGSLASEEPTEPWPAAECFGVFGVWPDSLDGAMGGASAGSVVYRRRKRDHLLSYFTGGGPFSHPHPPVPSHGYQRGSRQWSFP